METYSLNPQIIPGKPLSEHDHRKVRATLVVVILIAVVLGITFWISVANKTTSVPPQDPTAVRDEVLSFLKNNQVQLTQSQIDSVVTQLSGSNVKVSTADRDAALSQLKH